MTPPARIAAAIEVLDRILDGAGSEQAMRDWSKGSRFAGSKDRAAVRDHVFDALRRRRSYAAVGGSDTGRGLMIGALRAADIAPETMFSGEGYGPPALNESDGAPWAPSEAESLDCPDWISGQLKDSLGPDYEPVLKALQDRAPVYLRVNLRAGSVDHAIAALVADGVTTAAVKGSNTAVIVIDGPRKIAGSRAYLDGLVELQDLSSQAVVAALPLAAGMRILDYCAGGGGKTLAMAGRVDAEFFAHDVAPARMRDLPARAARADISVAELTEAAVKSAAPFDFIIADAPCSGSGSWRRDPLGKWRLTADRLDELCQIQASIITKIAKLAAPNGVLAYVTCSMLDCENEMQVAAFLAQHPDWRLERSERFSPLTGGDGFFLAVLQHNEQ